MKLKIYCVQLLLKSATEMDIAMEYRHTHRTEPDTDTGTHTQHKRNRTQ